MTSTTTGLIIAVPPHAETLRVAGLHVPVRLTRQFRKAGINGPVVWLFSGPPGASPLGKRASREKAATGTPGDIPAILQSAPADIWVGVPGDLVFSGEGLTEILAGTASSGITPAGWGLTAASSASGRLISWSTSVCEAEKAAPPDAKALDPPAQAYCRQVTDTASAHAMGKKVLHAARRKQDPNFARFTGRHFSYPLSLLAIRWGLTPNMVTSLAVATGLLGALLILKAQYVWVISGTLLMIISRLLDDCDGEIARMTFQQTRFGAVFDIACDVTVHLSFFLALGFGLHISDPAAGHLLAMGLLVFGGLMTTMLLLCCVTNSNMRDASPLIALLERTASGDVAYIFLLFALAGKPQWFLWAAALGAQAYWLALAVSLLIHYRRKRP